MMWGAVGQMNKSFVEAGLPEAAKEGLQSVMVRSMGLGVAMHQISMGAGKGNRHACSRSLAIPSIPFVMPQVCEDEKDVAAALAAWAGDSPGQDWQKHEQAKKKRKITALDRFLQSGPSAKPRSQSPVPATQAGAGQPDQQGPAAAAADLPAPAAPPAAAATGGASSGAQGMAPAGDAAKSDAFSVLMASARQAPEQPHQLHKQQQQQQPQKSRHEFGQGRWGHVLASLAAHPEKCAGSLVPCALPPALRV